MDSSIVALVGEAALRWCLYSFLAPLVTEIFDRHCAVTICMDKGVAIGANNSQVGGARELWCVLKRQLLSVMDLKHADSLTTQKYREVYTTCFAHAM